jgi:putative hydrolase of the HAD superfamily
MNYVKNIIFDLGGVLINLDYPATEKKFKEFGLSNFNELFNQAKQNRLFDLYETGKISSDFFINEIINLSHHRLNRERIIEAWNAMLLDLPVERIEFLESINKRYQIFLLSNTNEIHIQSFKEILNFNIGYNRFLNCFKKVYYSFEIGLRKPDTEIFNFVLNQHNLIASETIFIDDSAQHILGAERCGIKSFLLDTQNTNVISLLQQFGI